MNRLRCWGLQSTRQGRNALAGSSQIQSADPTNDFEIKGRGEIGERGTFFGAFALNVPVIEDTFALRFVAEHLATDGFVRNSTLGIDDFDDCEQKTLRAKAWIDPTEDLSVIFSGSCVRSFGGEDLLDIPPFPEDR
ncbi:MAG: hypothetical protein AAF501_10840 [Pseudomonadota bacterium]